MPRRSPLRGGLRKPTLYTFGEAELLGLDNRTALILRMRSGIWDGQLYTLDEVGERVGVSRERVRQVQSDGLLRIRQLREAQRHLRDEPKIGRALRGRQLAGRVASTAKSTSGLINEADNRLPGWEVYVPLFVHPVKVAIVEALFWMGAPLSPAHLTKLFSGGGEDFREPKVRYHLHKLVEVGVLEIVPTSPFSEENRGDAFFYFLEDDGS